MKLRTTAMTVRNTHRAKFVSVRLIDMSQWFEFTPLPCDEYEFKVKEENGGRLQELVTAAYVAYPPVEGEDSDSDDE